IMDESPPCNNMRPHLDINNTIVHPPETNENPILRSSNPIPLTGDGSVTRTTDGTAGNSGTASKTWADATIAITPATATNAVGTNLDITNTVTPVPTALGNGSSATNKTIRPVSFVVSAECS